MQPTTPIGSRNTVLIFKTLFRNCDRLVDIGFLARGAFVDDASIHRADVVKGSAINGVYKLATDEQSCFGALLQFGGHFTPLGVAQFSGLLEIHVIAPS